MARSDPNFARTFGEGGPQQAQYQAMFGEGAVPPAYEGFGKVPKYGGTTQAAAQGVYGAVPEAMKTPEPKGKGGGDFKGSITSHVPGPDPVTPMSGQAAEGKGGGGSPTPAPAAPPVGAQGDGKGGASPKGSYKGAGNYTPVPTGAPGGPQAAPAYNPAQFQQKAVTTPTTSQVTPYNINPAQYKQMQQVGMETIGQGAKQAQSQLMKQMGAKGLGQSGLAMQGAIDQYQRGAGLAQSQLGRQLGADWMGNQFKAGMQATGLEAQRDLAQGQMDLKAQQLDLTQRYQAAGLSQAEAAKRAELEMANRKQNLATSLGLGNLGLAEQAQDLAALTAERKWEDAPLSALAGLGQSAIAAGASGGGGKGGGK